MVTVCLTCGDEGATNAFVYCVECLDYAVHRYCLDVLPETLDEFVYWYCDDCEVLRPKKGSELQYDQKKKKTACPPGSHEFTGYDTPPLEECGKSTKKSLLSENIEHRLVVSHSEEPCSKACGGNECNGPTMIAFMSKVEGKVNPEQGPKIRLETYSFLVDTSVLAKPKIDQIWSGRFNIQNTGSDAFSVSVAAHVSINACQKVYNEDSLFPSSLQLEMHPREDVWPESFQETGPSHEDLALYFFPNEHRYEGIFDHLVLKMSTQERALKADTENAELLLFASSELPLKFWLFKRKCYLWGVFRDKKEVVSD